MALTELAKIPNAELDSLQGYRLFSDRASFLCKGLRLLNICLLFLIPGALGRLLISNDFPDIAQLFIAFDIAFFCTLFAAVFFLFKESQLTGRSILAHTQEIHNTHKRI